MYREEIKLDLNLHLPDLLTELNLVSVAVRLIFALACGGILGIERERKNRPAGLRTYMLVCTGATLAMMTNQYIFGVFGTGDVGRLGAQVISGIGFLGAGTIIVTGRNRVKGLTTAAGLWASACIGLALGIGFYIGAIASCLLMYVVMAYLRKLDDKMKINNKIINLYIELSQLADMGNFIKVAKDKGFKVSDIEVAQSSVLNKNAPGVAILLTITGSKKEIHEDIIHSFRTVEGVINIEEI